MYTLVFYLAIVLRCIIKYYVTDTLGWYDSSTEAFTLLFSIFVNAFFFFKTNRFPDYFCNIMFYEANEGNIAHII